MWRACGRRASGLWRTVLMRTGTERLARWPSPADDSPVQRRGGAERVSEDRIAPVAIDFISFCFSRRAREWPYLYDEMCYVASNRLYRGLGYQELREAGLGLTLVGLARTSRIVTEVMSEIQERPAGGVVAARQLTLDATGGASGGRS